jgi:spermidine dehydrogenase
MKKTITRRDFLNGSAITLAAGSALSPTKLLAQEQGIGPVPLPKEYYPPSLTGIRGSHKGSFDVAHDLAWRGKKPESYTSLKEEYDLIIVGAGISGLAAAYFYRQQAGADKKILILDNHDDFGGHAKRNEFQSDGRMLLGPGGSFNLEYLKFSDTANRLMEELGVDFDKLNEAREPDYFLGQLNSDHGYFLNEKHYGNNKIIQGNWVEALDGSDTTDQLIAELELPEDEEARLLALIKGEKDLLDDLSVSETMDYIRKTPYEQFLTEKAGLSQNTIQTFESFSKIFGGLGLESFSTEYAFLLGCPGANSVGYTGKLANKMLDTIVDHMQLPVFPDGNASVARMLVRKLIPQVAPGSTMEDIVTARFDYSQLDQPKSPVRIRLNSTVVNAKNIDGGTEVSYVEHGQAYTLKSKQCILACYNGLIPHLCPELSQAQKENLKYGVKIPLVMTNVLLRDSSAVNASGPVQYHCPGSHFSVVTKTPPVSLGDYKDPSSQISDTKDNPLVLWMCHVPAPRNNGKQNARDLYRLGRYNLYSTPFSTYENAVKDQLTAMFGANGFDAEKDIEAITVNRWSHGYTYGYSSLYDPDWEEGQAPHELARIPFGNISIANTDSEATAYLHTAIDAAARAVGDLVSA